MVVNWLLFNFCRSFGQQKIHTKCPVSDLVCCPDILLHTGKGFPWLLYANTLGTHVVRFMIMNHNLLHILKLQIIYVIKTEFLNKDSNVLLYKIYIMS